MKSASLTLTTATMCLTIGLLTGCRSIGQLTGDKNATARAGTVWNTPLPELEPPGPDRRTVFVAYRNASDAEFELDDEIEGALAAEGWNVTDDPAIADYRMRVTLRYWGENESGDMGVSTANALGGIAGVGAGLAVGSVAYEATDSSLIGVGAGAATGGLTALAVRNFTTPREWNAVLDIVVDELVEGGVTYRDSRDSSRDSATVLSSNTGGGRATGSARDSNSRSASFERKSDFYEHPVRLTGWARQYNMSEEEALPLVLEKLRRVLPRTMPAI